VEKYDELIAGEENPVSHTDETIYRVKKNERTDLIPLFS
jgi:hypothetical protein